jgi:hypothetical protein
MDGFRGHHFPFPQYIPVFIPFISSQIGYRAFVSLGSAKAFIPNASKSLLQKQIKGEFLQIRGVLIGMFF